MRVFDAAPGRVRLICGQTVNLSAGGVAVQLAEAIEEGTWVETLIPRSNQEALCLCGTVVYSQRVLTSTFEIGIEIAVGAHPAFT